MYNDLFGIAKVTRVSNAVAAGTTDINSTGVDMSGFDTVAFIVAFGAITSGAVTSIKAQQDTASDFSVDAQDLLGTAVTVADDDDNQTFGVAVHRPGERYVRCVVDRATQNAVVDGIWAIQYNAKDLPVTQPSTFTYEFHASPAEGTA